MSVGDAAELAFPVAVEDGPVDVAAGRVRRCGVPTRLGRGETDMARGALGVVGIDYRLHRLLRSKGSMDCGDDPAARIVGDLGVGEQGGVRSTFAVEVIVDPVA